VTITFGLRVGFISEPARTDTIFIITLDYEVKNAPRVVESHINSNMRFNEFKSSNLRPYRITVVLSDNSSAQTLIYADTPENAWLIASKQYGANNIVSVDDPRAVKAIKPVDRPSAMQFWANRFRKYAILAKPEPKPTEFADQVDDYLQRQEDRQLARVKAEKAKWQLRRT
jgi:hypothetical protein